MSINDYEPLFGEWYVESLIGAGTFGKVYRIKREEYGKTYFSALKWISIPNNKAEIKNLRCDGMDADSISEYFSNIVRDLTNEIQLMSRLRGQSCVVSYEDHKIIAKANGIGFNIFIRMELLTSLNDHMLAHTYSSTDIIHLGINICEALELCQKYNIIHRDIKPDNIFVTDLGNYKLGDFGIARQLERTMSNMSTKGTFNYMAPEVYKQLKYDSSVDLYSLGIVLYRLFNNGRLPFLPLAPNPIRPEDRDESIIRRLSGEPMTFPQNAPGRLGEIILKACAYDPKDRYTSPKHLRYDLEAIQFQLSECNNPYEQIYSTPSYRSTTTKLDKTTTQTIGSTGGESELAFASKLSMYEKDLNTHKTQQTRTLNSYSENAIRLEYSERARVMSKEATLRKPEETKKQLGRIRKRKEEKLNKILNVVIFSLVGCAAVLGIVLATKLINKGANGQQVLNFGRSSITSKEVAGNGSDFVTSLAKDTESSPQPNIEGENQNAASATAELNTPVITPIIGNWSNWGTTEYFASDTRDVESKDEYRYRDKQLRKTTETSLSGWTFDYSELSWGEFGGWSAWSSSAVTPSESREVETATQYSYRDIEYAENSASILSGWTQYDSYTTTGDWCSWQSEPISESPTVHVENRVIYRYYHYRCANCGLFYPFRDCACPNCSATIPRESYDQTWKTTAYKDSGSSISSASSNKRVTYNFGSEAWFFSKIGRASCRERV